MITASSYEKELHEWIWVSHQECCIIWIVNRERTNRAWKNQLQGVDDLSHWNYDLLYYENAIRTEAIITKVIKLNYLFKIC